MISYPNDRLTSKSYPLAIGPIRTIKVLVLTLLLIMMFQKSECVSSIPFHFGPVQQMQSKTLSLAPSTSFPYMTSYNYTYNTVKMSPVSIKDVFWSIHEMDYDVNNRSASWTGYFIYYSVTVTPYQQYAQITYGGNNKLMVLKLTILVLDPSFLPPDLFRFHMCQYQKGVSETYSFTLLSTTNYVVLKYMIMNRIRTVDFSYGHIQINLSDSVSGSNYQCQITFDGSFSLAYVAVRFFVIYKDAAIPYQIKLQHYVQYYSYTVSSPSRGFQLYNSSTSHLIFGISSFHFDAVSYLTTTGFQWTLSSSVSGTQLYVYIYRPSFFFSSLDFTFLAITRYGCINQAFPFRGTNSSNSQIECFDKCRTDQFIQYDSAEMYQKCTNCASLCATCLDATQCSSCITGYVLDDTTMTCNLSPMYYMNGASPDLCSNAMTGCVECSDSTTCTVCDSTYYFSSGSCTQCSTHHPNCIKCSPTECLECQASMVLTNGTLCLATQAPAFIPSTPNGAPVPCTDPFCVQCNYLNVSQCIICSSSLYTLINGECKTVCGDSLIDGTDVCDDGNKIDFDGCSSDCLRVEDGFQCDTIPSRLAGYDTSHCYVTQSIKVDILSIRKSEMENRIKIILRNSFTKILDWESIDQNDELSEMFALTVPKLDSQEDGYVFAYEAQFIKEASEVQRLKDWMKLTSPEFYQQQRNLQQSSFNADLYEFIDLSVTYASKKDLDPLAVTLQSLTHQQSKLVFNPAATQRKAFKGPASSSASGSASLVQSSVQFPLKTDDNQLIQSYTAQYYNSASMISTLGTIASVLTLVLLIIAIFGFILDGKNGKQMLITLETVFIGQLAYFSMYGIGELNLLFLRLAPSMKFMTGFDLSLSPPENNHSFRELLGLGITSVHFSDNVNVSLVLVMACMLVGGILLLLHKLVFSKQSAKKNFVKDSEEEHREEVPESTESEKKEENKSYKVGMFLVFNLGFGLFLLFFYKCLFFTCIQVKYGMSSLALLDMVLMSIFGVILLFYLILLFAKIDYFDSLLESVGKPKSKINIFDRLSKNPEITRSQIKKIEERFQKYLDMLPDNEKPESMRQSLNQKPLINVKFLYIFLIIIEHIANIMVLAFLFKVFTFHESIPMLIYLLKIVFSLKYRPYKYVNIYRLNITYFIGASIQTIMLIRNFLLDKALEQNLQQKGFGLYCSFSIIGLAIIITFVANIFNIYFIKKIRCCQLNIEQEKAEISNTLKLKLQSIIKEEASIFNEKNQSKKKNKKSSNQSNVFDGNIDQQNNNDQDEEQSYNDQKNPFYNLPDTLKDSTKQVISMFHNPNRQNANKNRNFGNSIKQIDIPINQQITIKSLKKQIKEKLLSSRIQEKLVRRKSGKDHVEDLDRVLINQTKKIKQKSNDCFVPTQPELDGKDLVRNILLKKKNTQSHLNSPTFKGQTEVDVGYIYTDKKYDVYEQFDMI